MVIIQRRLNRWRPAIMILGFLILFVSFLVVALSLLAENNSQAQFGQNTACVPRTAGEQCFATDSFRTTRLQENHIFARALIYKTMWNVCRESAN